MWQQNWFRHSFHILPEDFTYIFNSIGTWAYIAYSTWNIGSVWLIMMLGSGIYRVPQLTCFRIFFRQTLGEFGRCHSSGSYVFARLSSLFGRIKRKLPRWLPWSRAVQCWGITSGRSELGDMEWVQTYDERQRWQRKDTKRENGQSSTQWDTLWKDASPFLLTWSQRFKWYFKWKYVKVDLTWSTLFYGGRIRRSTCRRLFWVTLYRFMTDAWPRYAALISQNHAKPISVSQVMSRLYVKYG